jgi:hypothetical protein
MSNTIKKFATHMEAFTAQIMNGGITANDCEKRLDALPDKDYHVYCSHATNNQTAPGHVTIGPRPKNNSLACRNVDAIYDISVHVPTPNPEGESIGKVSYVFWSDGQVTDEIPLTKIDNTWILKEFTQKDPLCIVSIPFQAEFIKIVSPKVPIVVKWSTLFYPDNIRRKLACDKFGVEGSDYFHAYAHGMCHFTKKDENDAKES